MAAASTSSGPSRPEGDKPRIPDEDDFYKRTTSFRDWPKGTGVKVSELVNSGFIYLGIADRVQCFHCGEILDNWRESDDVDKEHMRLSPRCGFIRKKLGNNDQSQPSGPAFGQSNSRIIQPSEPLRRDVPFSRCMDVFPQTENAPKKNLHPVAPRDIRARLDTAMSRKLLEMGFKKPLLAQVIGERLAEVGDDFESFMEYFLAVKNAEQIMSGGQVDTLKAFYDKMNERISNPASILEGDTDSEQSMGEDDGAELTGGAAPASTNHTPTDRGISTDCQICQVNKADTFIPCRHLNTCARCADQLQDCTICRKTVGSCIRVSITNPLSVT